MRRHAATPRPAGPAPAPRYSLQTLRTDLPLPLFRPVPGGIRSCRKWHRRWSRSYRIVCKKAYLYETTLRLHSLFEQVNARYILRMPNVIGNPPSLAAFFDAWRRNKGTFLRFEGDRGLVETTYAETALEAAGFARRL